MSLDYLAPEIVIVFHWLGAFHLPFPNSKLPLCGCLWEPQLLQLLDPELFSRGEPGEKIGNNGNTSGSGMVFSAVQAWLTLTSETGFGKNDGNLMSD